MTDDYAELRAALQVISRSVWTDSDYDARVHALAALDPLVIAALLADRDRKTEALVTLTACAWDALYLSEDLDDQPLGDALDKAVAILAPGLSTHATVGEISDAIRAALRGSGEENVP